MRGAAIAGRRLVAPAGSPPGCLLILRLKGLDRDCPANPPLPGILDSPLHHVAVTSSRRPDGDAPVFPQPAARLATERREPDSDSCPPSRRPIGEMWPARAHTGLCRGHRNGAAASTAKAAAAARRHRKGRRRRLAQAVPYERAAIWSGLGDGSAGPTMLRDRAGHRAGGAPAAPTRLCVCRAPWVTPTRVRHSAYAGALRGGGCSLQKSAGLRRAAPAAPESNAPVGAGPRAEP